MCRIRLSLFYLLCTFSQLHAQDRVDTTLPDLIPYRKGNLWGFCDNKREIKIQPQYYSVSSFRHNYAEVWMDTLMKGVINKTGELILKAGKDTVLYVTEAGRAYKHFGKGAIEIAEPSGNLFKPEKYCIEGSFTSTSYIAKLGEKRGVVDNKEKIIIPFRYLEIGYPDKSGSTWININGRRAIIDTLGKFITPKLKKKIFYR